MNTTLDTTKPSWLRRTLLAMVATVAAVAGLFVATPAPAQAATYGTVTACFQSSYTLYNTTYWGPAMYTDAYVEVWNGSAWVSRATTRTNNQGCAAYSVQTGYYWRMRVYFYTRPYRLVGTTGYAYVANTLNYGLGTTKLATINVG